FFSSSGAPSVLPSFPTRRSSDLALVGGDAADKLVHRHAGGCRKPQPLAHLALRAGGDIHSRSEETPGARDVEENTRVAHWLDERDRKSTRLNSSHVSISYAVFCL